MEKKFEMLFEKVADRNNTTPEEVRRELQGLADRIYEDPELREKLPFESSPTPEELVAYIAAHVAVRTCVHDAGSKYGPLTSFDSDGTLGFEDDNLIKK